MAICFSFRRAGDGRSSLGFAEPLAEELVDERGVRAPSCGLHDLAHEKADDGLLARAVLLDLLRVGGDHLLDRGGDRGLVGYLAETPLGDDGGRIRVAAALTARCGLLRTCPG